MSNDFLTSALNFLSKVNDALKKDDEEPEILTAEKISNLKWMSTNELAAIYKYGKRKVKIADDPRAYSELKWMTSSQLKAIFGKDDSDELS